MSRLETAIARAKLDGRPLFVPFWVLGDPDEEASLEVLRALVAAGADALELGIPFSDPPADGPVIQAAQTRALSTGMTPHTALSLVARLREETAIPLFVMVYANLVLQHEGGLSGFVARAVASGVDVLLVPDVPLEETRPFEEECRAAGLGLAQMITELTGHARAEEISARATGYLYVVSRAGTTGTHAGVGERLATTLARARSVSALPLIVGFGVSSHDDVERVVAAGADGVIVGSALVRLAASSEGDLAGRVARAARAIAGRDP